MSDWRKFERKQCAKCHAIFMPLSNVSRPEWKNRQFCSPKCAADARWAAVRAEKKGGGL
jgi:hypothetical protein